jgi:Na+-transporting NADH:ubiquinone oxidoreductase subunit NqrD
MVIGVIVNLVIIAIVVTAAVVQLHAFSWPMTKRKVVIVVVIKSRNCHHCHHHCCRSASTSSELSSLAGTVAVRLHAIWGGRAREK